MTVGIEKNVSVCFENPVFWFSKISLIHVVEQTHYCSKTQTHQPFTTHELTDNSTNIFNLFESIYALCFLISISR